MIPLSEFWFTLAQMYPDRSGELESGAGNPLPIPEGRDLAPESGYRVSVVRRPVIARLSMSVRARSRATSSFV
jgi:hypothetical protein